MNVDKTIPDEAPPSLGSLYLPWVGGLVYRYQGVMDSLSPQGLIFYIFTSNVYANAFWIRVPTPLITVIDVCKQLGQAPTIVNTVRWVAVVTRWNISWYCIKWGRTWIRVWNSQIALHFLPSWSSCEVAHAWNFDTIRRVIISLHYNVL